MKKNDVYGIGNALVDTMYKVDPSFFEENSIEKGVMELINEEKYINISEKLRPFQVELAGGGSAANSMIALAQLGGKGHYAFKVADDEDGNFYRDDLKKGGVSYSTNKLESGTTGRCMVMVTPDADRTMNTYLGITEQFSVKELDEEAIKNSEYIYIEGYLVSSPTALEAAVKASNIANKAGVKRALTFSDPNMVKFFKAELDTIIDGKIDLLFCNFDEASCYTGSTDLNEVVEKLKMSAEKFVITLGDKGALVYDGNEIVEVASRTVTAVDTVGAGDMFAGVFLYGITHGESMARSATKACLAASEVVSVYGARMDGKLLKKIVEF